MSAVFDHIAVATPQITDAPDFLVGKLGGISGYGGPSGNFKWWHWDFEGGGRIEVIEPDGPPGGFVHRYLEHRGPGIHHVNFEIDSLRETCDRAEALGHTVVGYDDSHEFWKEAFLHPKGAMGIVVQLVQASHHDHDHESWDWNEAKSEPPAQPANPPSPVTIAGLRMRSGDAAAVRRQWGELMGGEATETADGLAFRWEGSPMRVAVTIEDGAPNEAFSIEVQAARTLELPAGLQAAFGTRFVQIQE